METKSSRLLKTTLIYAIGNMGSKLLSFILLPFYSYYLTNKEYGYYDIILTTISLLVPLITLQLSDSVFRWLITSNNKVKRKEIISNSLIVILFNILVVSLTLLVAQEFIEIQDLFLIYLLLILSSIYPVIQQVARGLSRSKIYAISGVFFSFSLLVFNIIFLFLLKLSIQGLLIASIISYLIGLVYLMLKLKLCLYFNVKFFSLFLIKDLLRYSSPLIINTISWWLIVSANKYLVLYFLGKESLGLFSFANKFPGLLLMINSIFILAWQESMILNFKNKDRSHFFSKIFNLLLKVQFSITAILILSSEIMIKLLVSDTFYSSWNYMPILYLGVAFSTFAGFYGAIYLGAKDTKASLRTSLVGGIVNIIIALLLIKPFELYGIAVANMVSFFVLFLNRSLTTKKYIELSIDKKKASILITIVLLSLFIVYLKNTFISTLSLLMLLIYLYVENRKILTQILIKIKNKIYGVSKLQ